MAGMPTGTVTFLFSDVEGSTRLLAELGDEYARHIVDHDRLLRAAFDAEGGHVVDSQTESFFVAFQRASDAVTAAAAVQRALVDTPLRVRVGIHTGQPSVAGHRYLGLDVHRAARICGAAHGGQVLLSQTTKSLVEQELPNGTTLLELGKHRLRDLSAPQHLSQLLIAGVRNEFPPVRTLESRPTNLPVQPTPLIGREREVATVTELLGRDDIRLLTLTGTGGSGKTRLALQAAAELAEEYANGVFVVTLEPLENAALVLATVAQTLGVTEQGGNRVAQVLQRFVGEKRLLLVLDGFERLREAATDVSALLAACPALNVVVTSRAPLHLAAEREYHVPSLAQDDAVALFVERSQAVNADFALTESNAAAVAELCVRLDGLPLAIELAAARIRLFSPQALLGRLEQRLELLTGGPRDLPARQQTLRNTIDWSHDLLVPDEQRLFSRLAVFAGGCSLEAAEAVCDATLDSLDALVDNNLMRQVELTGGEPRFAMLESIRAYALDRLEASGEGDRVRGRHAEYLLELAEHESEEQWEGRRFDLSVLDPDEGNFRAALAWFAETSKDELYVRLTYALATYWTERVSLEEAARHADEALARASGLSRPLQLRATLSALRAAWKRNELERGRELAELALALAEESEDEARAAEATMTLGIVAARAHDYARADSYYADAQARLQRLGRGRGVAAALHNRGLLALRRNDFARARSLLEKAHELFALSEGKFGVANSLSELGFVALAERRLDDAVRLFLDSIERSYEGGLRSLAGYCLDGLAAVAATRGDFDEAARLLGAGEVLFSDVRERSEYSDAILDAALSPLRARLAEAPLAEALASGRAMTEAQALDYVQRTVVPGPT